MGNVANSFSVLFIASMIPHTAHYFCLILLPIDILIMKKRNGSFTVFEYESEKELSAADALLVKEAESSVKTAYAPYSKFRVGAAVLLANGKIIKGSNQENAAYPSGLCAERVALFAASSMYPGIDVKAIAVAVSSGNKNNTAPAAPCGGCRQVMAEFESMSKKKIKVLMKGRAKEIFVIHSVAELLPLAFVKEAL